LTTNPSPRNTDPPFTSTPSTPPTTQPFKETFLYRIYQFLPLGQGSSDVPRTTSNFRKILALAKPERKPLTIAIVLVCIQPSINVGVYISIQYLVTHIFECIDVGSSYNRKAYRLLFVHKSSRRIGLSLRPLSVLIHDAANIIWSIPYSGDPWNSCTIYPWRLVKRHKSNSNEDIRPTDRCPSEK
jgi:hypothetical protein